MQDSERQENEASLSGMAGGQGGIGNNGGEAPSHIGFDFHDKTVDLAARRGVRVSRADGAEKGKTHLLYPLLLSDTAENRAFLEALQGFRHRCFPQIEEYMLSQGSCYALGAPVSGKSLEGVGLLAPEEVFSLGRELCAALADAHRAGFCVGGFEPSDVLLTDKGILLPPPARRRDAEGEQRDLSSVGRFLFKGFTGGIPDAAPAFEALPEALPEGMRELTVCALADEGEERFSGAEQMLRAFDVAPRVGLFQKKRSRVLLFTFVGAILLAAASVLLTVFGLLRLDGDKLYRYDGAIARGAEAIQNGNYDEAGRAFDDALSQNPARLTAYYYKALALYRQGEMRACVDYIESELATRSFSLYEDDANLLNKLYYMLGACFYALDEPDRAYASLKKAMDGGYEDNDCTLLYVLSALRTNRQSEAAEVMEGESFGAGGETFRKAVERELSKDEKQAAALYEQAAKELANPVLVYECFRKSLTLYSEASDYDGAIALYGEAKGALEPVYYALLRQPAARAYHLRGISDSSDADLTEAARLYSEEIEGGKAGDADRINLSDCLVLLGRDGEAIEALKPLAEGESKDYAVYGRLAKAAYRVEMKKNKSERDFTEVLDYCDRTLSLYGDKAPDAEIREIEQIAESVRAGTNG